MAMDSDALGTKIAQDILVFCGQPAAGPAFAKEKALWTIIVKDIVDHIKENAEVPAGITLTTPNVGGTGSTTGTGKVT
jgi:hypothetical protein